MAGFEAVSAGTQQFADAQSERQRAQSHSAATKPNPEQLAADFREDVNKEVKAANPTGFAPEINPEVGGSAYKPLEQYRVDLQREHKALSAEHDQTWPLSSHRQKVNDRIDVNESAQNTVSELSRDSNLRVDFSGASGNRQMVFRAGDRSIKADIHRNAVWNMERAARNYDDSGQRPHPQTAMDGLPVMQRNFDAFDAAGDKDDSVSRKDLKAVINSSKYSDAQRGAALALMENDYTFFRADSAGADARGDGRVTHDELNRWMDSGGHRELTPQQYQQQAQDFIALKMAGKTDAYSQNRAITEAYAQMYHSDPNAFKWAGLGALASDKVGGAIKDASNYPDFMLGVSGKDLKADLAYGNRLLYNDLAWQHLAYQQGGIEGLRNAGAQGEIAPKQLEAWEQIDQGVKTGNDDMIWRGAEGLAYHEQNAVLTKMYDRHPDIWSKLSADGYKYRAGGMGAQEFPSPVDGGVTFHDFMAEGSNIGSFDDRWKWTQQSIIPEWKRQASEPSSVQNSMYNREIIRRLEDK